MGVDNTDKSSRTKAMNSRIVRGVAGRNMAIDMIVIPWMPSTWMFSLVVDVDSKMFQSPDRLPRFTHTTTQSTSFRSHSDMLLQMREGVECN